MQIIGNVGPGADYRSFATRRAASLGVFTSSPSAFEDEFTAKAGTSPSRWKTTLVSTGSASVLTDTPGGIMRLDSGATASSSAFASVGNGTDVPSMIADPGLAGTAWYCLWVFRMNTAINNQTIANLEFDRASGANVDNLLFGVDGQFISTTKFMAEENSNNTLSSVSIDTGWHYLEAWQTGVTRIVSFGFDGEPTKTLTLTGNIGAACRPGINVTNGTTAASRQLDTDHFILLMPGNVALPVTP